MITYPSRVFGKYSTMFVLGFDGRERESENTKISIEAQLNHVSLSITTLSQLFYIHEKEV